MATNADLTLTEMCAQDPLEHAIALRGPSVSFHQCKCHGIRALDADEDPTSSRRALDASALKFGVFRLVGFCHGRFVLQPAFDIHSGTTLHQ
jgi:hypothetical protein